MDDYGHGKGEDDRFKRVMGRTRNDWHLHLQKAQFELEQLEHKKTQAIILGMGEDLGHINKQINIATGSIIAAQQVLMSEPFNEVLE